MTYQDQYMPIRVLCGAEAEFDHGSGCSYRCTTCNATIGSVGMPRRCAQLYEMEEVAAKLRGNDKKPYCDLL